MDTRRRIARTSGAGCARRARRALPRALAVAVLASTVGLGSPADLGAAAAGEAVAVAASPAGLSWQPAIDYRAATLVVAGADGIVARRQLGAGEPIAFVPVDGDGQPLADGWYRWELRLAKALEPAVAEALQAAEEAGDDAGYRRIVRSVGGTVVRASGRFRVAAGSIQVQDRTMESPAGERTAAVEPLQPAAPGAAPEPLAPVNADDSVTITGASPELNFIDNDASAKDFTLEADADELNVYDVDAATRVVGIEAGSSADSIYVAPGSVGLFTSTPDSPDVELHVASDGDDVPELRLEDTGATPQEWDLRVVLGDFQIVDQSVIFPNTVLQIERTPAGGGTAIYETILASETTTIQGDLTVDGDVALGSSRDLKTAFEAVSGDELLAALEKLELSTWSYRKDPNGARHLGPVAEEFHELFGLGRDDKHISPADTAGLALAVAQELAARLREKETRIAGLEERLAALERRLLELSAAARAAEGAAGAAPATAAREEVD